jgi:hypothetical protein
MISADLRKRRQKPHTTWHLDEVYLKIDGRMVYLWRGCRRWGPGSRCAGPVQAKQARRVEADAQAPQEVCFCSRAIDHGRLAIIQRCGPCSWDRAPPPARAMEEQSVREFATPNATAGAQHAAVQEPGFSPEIPVNATPPSTTPSTSNVTSPQPKRTASFELWRWTHGAPPWQQPEKP